MSAPNVKVDNNAVSVPMQEKFTNLRNLAPKSVCNIRIASKELGTGALYQVQAQNGEDLFLFITCNHLLPTTSRKEINHSILEFEDIEQMKSIRLEKENIKFVWTTKVFNATIIEISNELASRFESCGAHFLKLCAPISVLDEVTRKIAILKYNFGKVHVEQGELKELCGIEVMYRIGTAPGSSGSPLLTIDCEALAMHNDVASGTIFFPPTAIHKAICIRAVIKEFLKEKSYCERNAIILRGQLSSLKIDIAKLKEEKHQVLNRNNRLESELAENRKELHDLRAKAAKGEVAGLAENHHVVHEEVSNPIWTFGRHNQRTQPKSASETHLNQAGLGNASVQMHDHENTAGQTTAVSNAMHLKHLKRVSHRNFKRSNSESIHVWGLCLISEDMVLLACGTAGLRALSLHRGQISSEDPCELKNVHSLVFDAPTGTLILAVWVEALEGDGVSGGVYWLVAMQRQTDRTDRTEKYTEIQRVQTEVKHVDFGPWYVSFSAVCDSRVLFGEHDTERLSVFEVSEEHEISPVGTVLLENQFRVFTCTREGPDSLVAFSHDDNTVSLHRLVALRLETLARVQLTDPWDLLFRGQTLIVSDYKDIRKQAIVYMDTHGGHISRQRQLLEANAKVCVEQWCLREDHLIVLDYNSKDLLIYSIE